MVKLKFKLLIPALGIGSALMAQFTPCGGPTLDPSTNITMSWPVGDGNGYQFQLDTVSNFQSPLYSLSYGSSALSVSLPLQYGKHYYWRRAPTYNGSWGQFSATCDFFTTSTVSAPTAAPIVYTPQEDQPEVSTINFSWGGSGGSTNYEYQYSTSSTFSGASTFTTNTTNNNFVSTLTESTTYYFRVRGRNSAGTGPWSVSRRFFTRTPVTSMTLKAFLQGPLVVGGTPLMSDGLRTNSLIPASEPYTGLGLYVRSNFGATLTPSLLTTTGNNAIVDWVLVQIHNGLTNAFITSYAMLVQRDGDVVMPNGTVPSFNFPMSPVKIAVRHRNHLGAMTNDTYTPNGSSITVNLLSTTTNTFGTNARYTNGTTAALWAGDCNGDGTVLYTGSNNDRDRVLSAIGGVVPTNSAAGYLREDVNMSGTTLYTGSGNDRDIVLSVIGGVVPTNSRVQQLP